MMLTEKQEYDREYYRTHRTKILRQHREYQATHREEINASRKGRRNRAFNRRCFLCGGAVVEDEALGLWQCLNPECECEFKEV